MKGNRNQNVYYNIFQCAKFKTSLTLIIKVVANIFVPRALRIIIIHVYQWKEVGIKSMAAIFLSLIIKPNRNHNYSHNIVVLGSMHHKIFKEDCLSKGGDSRVPGCTRLNYRLMLI